MKEILANPKGLGIKLKMPTLTDTRWLGWNKFAYSKELSDGIKIEIHFNALLDEFGNFKAVDDFKFIGLIK